MQFSRFRFITFTVTIAEPGVFSSTGHELIEDDTVQLETSGALPTGLLVDTTYYVIRNGIAADSFQLSTSMGGDAITTSGTQSGTHQYIKTNRARLIPNIEDNK